MSKLLYKEYSLALHPLYFLFVIMGAMVLIPDYCYYAIFIYVAFIVVNNIFTSGKANKDTEYTVLLPICKRDVVKARFLSIVTYEAVSVLVTAVCAVVSYFLYDGAAKNNAGIEANPAFFGFILAMLGGFNFIYLTGFYKTGHKVFKPIILSAVFIVLFIGVAETLAQYVQSPVSAYLDSYTPEGMLMQIPVLAGGIIIFVILNLLGYAVSAKRFERLDL